MPIGVPFQSLPSQTFSITLDGYLFEVTIKTTNGCMCASLTVNGVETVTNMRVAAGSPIIPARYLEAGNFMLLTANQQLPDYRIFNVSQSLFYFTASELTTYRTPPTPPVTELFFDPVGGLPLRFSPQNYTEA